MSLTMAQSRPACATASIPPRSILRRSDQVAAIGPE
jgi:hypothetical protein